MNINWLASIGLVLDIIGAIILFMYGLPSKAKSHGGALILEENPSDKKFRDAENKKIERWANIGLILIIAGFLFQLVATNLKGTS